MAWHGRLRQLNKNIQTSLECIAKVLAVALVVFANACFAAQPKTEVDTQIRVRWSAEQNRFWQVRVHLQDELNHSQFFTATNRCESLASTGGYQFGADRKTMTFVPRQVSAGGEFDLRVQCSRGAKLQLQIVSLSQYSLPLSDDDLRWRRGTRVIDVQELLSGKESAGTVENETGKATYGWSVSRLATDKLRIDGLDESAQLQVGQNINFRVRLNSVLSQLNKDLVVHYELREAASGKVVSEKDFKVKSDAHGNSEPLTIDEACPSNPGVYQVRCRLEEKEENLLVLMRRKGETLVTVSRPIVVWQPDKSSDGNGVTWASVASVHPGKKADWEINQWLPSTSKKLLRRIDLMDEEEIQRSTHAGQPVVTLSPGKQYSASLPSRQTSYPHKVTIRFASGPENRIRVEIGDSDKLKHIKRTFTLIDNQFVTGDDWSTRTFLYYPSPDDDYIRITNDHSSSTFALESISVQAGPAYLSSNKTNWFSTSRDAVLSIPSFDWINALTADLRPHKQLDPSTVAAFRFATAAQRLTDYAKASGYNAIKIPSSQKARLWFDTNAFLANRKADSFDPHSMETLLRTCDQVGLKTYITFNPNVHWTEIESQLANNRAGLPILRRSRAGSAIYDLRHPFVQQTMRETFTAIDQRFSVHESYAGLILQCEQNNHLAPLAFEQMNSTTMAEFAADTGKQTVSPANLNVWIRGDGRLAMEKWLAKRSNKIYQSLVSNIKRQTLFMVAGSANGNESEYGNTINVQDYRRLSTQMLATVNHHSLRSETPHPTAAVAVAIGDRMNPGSVNKASCLQLTSAEMSDVMVSMNPNVLVVEDASLAFGLNADLHAKLVDFVALPAKGYVDLPGTDPGEKTIRVRYVSRDDGLVLSVINLAPWTSEIQIDCAEEFAWQAMAENVVGKWNAQGRTLNLTMQPNSTATFQTKAANQRTAPIRRWTSRVHGGQTAVTNIKQEVTKVVQRIGSLSDPQPYDQLSNGSFEKVGGVGIVGWMHTQYPPKAVQVVTNEAAVGKNSVLLNNVDLDAGRAWLVSKNIATPKSGRLAVSIACRAEVNQEQTPHVLRISIEGTRDGQLFRISKELNVPHDGKWQAREVVLEANNLDPQNVQTIRLTVDSLTKGRIWVDDVQLHDWFPTTAERDMLQSDAFMAVKGMQRGNLTPAARLLHNYWAQQLIQLPEQSTPEAVRKTIPDVKPAAGVADRIKGWIPSLKF